LFDLFIFLNSQEEAPRFFTAFSQMGIEIKAMERFLKFKTNLPFVLMLGYINTKDSALE
jgi:hypothetical protein